MAAKKFKHSERGMASVEVLPLIIMFVVLMFFALGFFGVIHTGVLYGIHARTYAFESLRNRAYYVYLRDAPLVDIDNPQEYKPIYYTDTGHRLHGIGAYYGGDAKLRATARPIKLGTSLRRPPLGGVSLHNDTHNVSRSWERADNLKVDPVWVMIQHGICMNAACISELEN